jgi:protein TonB
MSKFSIYESKWTNLVFENKNKEYGAYQLRQENSKTTITALFMGLLLLASIGSVSMLISKFTAHEPVESPSPIIDDVITVVDVEPLVRPKQPEAITPPAQQQSKPPVTEAAQLDRPVVVAADQATPVIADNTQNTAVTDNHGVAGTSVNPIPGSVGGGGENSTYVDPIGDPLPPAALDKMPDFPGGMAKFYTYVGNNFHRPELDAERILKVYVSFVVEKDGSLTDIMVKNDPGYGLGKEAVRVLKSLKTKWNPGILNGKAVRTAYTLPITIKTGETE